MPYGVVVLARRRSACGLRLVRRNSRSDSSSTFLWQRSIHSLFKFWFQNLQVFPSDLWYHRLAEAKASTMHRPMPRQPLRISRRPVMLTIVNKKINCPWARFRTANRAQADCLAKNSHNPGCGHKKVKYCSQTVCFFANLCSKIRIRIKASKGTQTVMQRSV